MNGAHSKRQKNRIGQNNKGIGWLYRFNSFSSNHTGFSNILVELTYNVFQRPVSCMTSFRYMH